VGEEVRQLFSRAVQLMDLAWVALTPLNSLALTRAEQPQYDWTINVGGEVGIKGWEDQTELKLVFENFSIPISGWAFLSIAVPVVVLLLAFAFYLIRQRTQFGSPSGSPNDR
jgi:hypothetical protein